MRYLVFILSLLVVVTGCKQETVGFSSAENTSYGDLPDNSPPPTGEGDTDPTPVQPPIVEITKNANDHLLGDSTDVAFKIIKGDFELDNIECFVDLEAVNCDLSTTKISLSGFNLGNHLVSIVVEDVEGLSGKNQDEWMVSQGYSQEIEKLEVEKQDLEADILFVIDNSKSMQAEQTEVANKISRFFEKIENLEWRVGIITTDPYARDPVTNIPNPLADGALLKFPNGQYHIDSSLPPSAARDLFANTIFRPEVGNGHERGIRNTYRAIEKSLSPGSGSANFRLNKFFRPKAPLSVVLISDENETLLDGADRPLKELDKSDGRNLANYVEKVWGSQKRFKFNSVIVRPGDNLCLGADESFGTAYSELSKLTSGLVEDICAPDYSGALKNIGDGVAALHKTFNLSCEPQDVDADGMIDLSIKTNSADPTPAYMIKGNVVEFEQALPPGDYEFEYQCLIPFS